MYSENNQQGTYQSVVCNFLSYVFHRFYTLAFCKTLKGGREGGRGWGGGGGGGGDKTEINSELLKF